MTELLVDAPTALTPRWLTAALEAGGHRPAGVETVEVSPVGTGQTGASYRLAVRWTEPTDLPSSFVVKLPAQDPEVRARVASTYRAEVAFYAQIAHTVDVPVPRCWFSAASEDASRFVLLLADLAPAVQGDQLAGCDVEVARAGAVALAGLHGPRWCDPTWDDLTVTMMPRPDAAGAAGLAEITATATTMFADTLGPRMTADDLATLNAFPALLARWLLLEPDRFALLHGDFRLDNLLLAPDGAVTVVDWQTIAVGLPARDLAYFVATSLLTPDRRAHEDELVAAYHRALLAYDVPDYDLAACARDYRLGMLHVLLISTLGWAFSSRTDRGDEMMLVMLQRACTAVRDLDSYALVAAGDRARARLLPAGRSARQRPRHRHRGARRRTSRPGRGVRHRALQPQGGRGALRRGRGRQRAHPHRHGGDQPQHPPPDGHRRLRADDAEPDRRPVHPRPGARHPADAGRLRHRPHHDRAAGGLRAGRAPAVPRRGRLRPRRTGRQLPRAAPRRDARRAPAAGAGRVRRQQPRARRPRASTTSSCTRTSPTRRRSAASGSSRTPPSRPAATRRRCASGRASPRSATTCPNRCG